MSSACDPRVTATPTLVRQAQGLGLWDPTLLRLTQNGPRSVNLPVRSVNLPSYGNVVGCGWAGENRGGA